MSLDYTFYSIDLTAYRSEAEPVFDRYERTGSSSAVIRLIEQAASRFRTNGDEWETEYSDPDFEEVLDFFREGRAHVQAWPGATEEDVGAAMLAKAQSLVLEALVKTRGADGGVLQFEFGRGQLAARLIGTSVWVAERFQGGVELSGGSFQYFGGSEADLFSEAELIQFRIEIQAVPTTDAHLERERQALLTFLATAPEGASKGIVRTLE